MYLHPELYDPVLEFVLVTVVKVWVRDLLVFALFFEGPSDLLFCDAPLFRFYSSNEVLYILLL